MKKYVFIFLLLIIAPLVISTVNYVLGDRRGNWQTADRSSAGLLPTASEYPDALIRVYAARTVRWRGIFAVHTWIVVKERGQSRYSRYDYTAWGEPIRVDGFAPDGRWFGAVPKTVVSVDGEEAENLVPKIRSVIENYRFRAYGDYSPWPGRTQTRSFKLFWTRCRSSKRCCRQPLLGKTIPITGSGLVSRHHGPACSSRWAAISD